MSGAAATLRESGAVWWLEITNGWLIRGAEFWVFPCRGMAVLFAAARGIVIEEAK